MNYSNSNIKITTEIKRCYTVYWETIDWPAVHLTQTMIQQRLVETYRKQDIGAVYRLQHEILQNRNMRLCAVKRVTTNKGAKTPGIDNETLKEPYEKWAASIRLLQWAHSLDTYKAKPVRRVLIPKDNGESRPLGIPTIFDRLAQCMYYQIIDPIVEDTSDRNSYGFRARRSCGDVIQQLTLLLGSPTSAKWILDADVAKCFDRINHEAILENCIVFNKKPILQWLKAPIHFPHKKMYKPTKGLTFITEESNIGTPQGGIISPMLCNIVLNGLEASILEFTEMKDTTYPGNPNYKTNLIRYADDFVILAPTKERLKIAEDRAKAFLKTRGLELNLTKTKIVNITEGFQIVGFWIQKRKYDYRKQLKPITQYAKAEGADLSNQLLITIPPDKVTSHKTKIRELFGHRRKVPRRKIKRTKTKTNKNRQTIDSIKAINRRVIGWRRYYAQSYATLWQFIDLDRWLTINKIIPYFRRKYATKYGDLAIKEVIKRFRSPTKNWTWRFGVKDDNGKMTTFERYYETKQHTESNVLKRKQIPSRTKGRIPPELNPYTSNGRNWWNTRASGIFYKASSEVTSLYSRVIKKYKNKCGLCGFDLGHDGQTTELHRIKPSAEGGKYTLKNVMPVHLFCHQRYHVLKKKELPIGDEGSKMPKDS